ncbi:MAG TPA: hypothetical protein VGM05_01490 [Planctomycetaceae bacterium]|jgi:hypothetical protein
MRITHGVLAAVIIAAATCVCADEHPTAVDLLKTFANSVNKMSCVRFNTRESVYPTNLGDGRSPDLMTETRILRDGVQWKLDTRQNTSPTSAKIVTHVWRQTLIERDVLQAEIVDAEQVERRPRLSVYRNDRPEHYWRFLGLSAIVFGRFPGDGGSPIWGVVRDASTRDVLPKAVEIDGAVTYVVKCRGKYGEHQLWIDPKRGGLPLRIEIQKQSGDLNDDEQLGALAATNQDGPTANAISIRIHNIKLNQREGVHFIAAFDFELSATYPSENTMRMLDRKQECRVTSMDMFSKPTTDATFRFDMQIPNGTRVEVFKNSRLGTGSTASGDSEIWIDGKLQKSAGR